MCEGLSGARSNSTTCNSHRFSLEFSNISLNPKLYLIFVLIFCSVERVAEREQGLFSIILPISTSKTIHKY
ncbi:hypothetical protein PHJA_000946200 [Phtheirospermum japonicum]|uniref:Uncharacterized protein n=1 Tax=Phtheirospermum japonicum TaxID=374723 RepID=A0A830BX95_9LAMI|nr:hypothetical protein PHJA_000946200 [Phtheirospermum japonicum]